MPKFIMRFDVDGEARYLEWSTIVDAPVTYGMTIDELREYYQDWYGRSAMAELDERLARADSDRCSSSMLATRDEEIAWNRAGAGETCLTIDQIVDYFIVRRGEGEHPVGRSAEESDP